MKKLLVINSSPRKTRSRSRKLTDVFVKYWKQYTADESIIFRDLGKCNIPHINENWIAGAFKPEVDRTNAEIEALLISTKLINELKEADVIIIGAPMYNWSITSSLKAYIDQILRINETWEFNQGDYYNPYVGLLKNKSLFLLMSRGAQGYEKGGYNEHINFQTPYLKKVFNIIGITDIHEVALNGEAFGSEAFELSIEKANLKIKKLIESYLV